MCIADNFKMELSFRQYILPYSVYYVLCVKLKNTVRMKVKSDRQNIFILCCTFLIVVTISCSNQVNQIREIRQYRLKIIFNPLKVELTP